MHNIQMNTRTLISHATEDKDRFVRAFAEKLRKRGIEAWYDEWEIAPGDSLVDKVFEEAIKTAGVVIVVLSGASIEKPWVRGELNASVIKRFEGKVKIIPVLIEECEVPEALKDTLYIRIKNLTSYDDELNRIVNSIFGATDKPALGPKPSYLVRTDMRSNLSAIDDCVLRVCYSSALKLGSDVLTPDTVLAELKLLDISKQTMLESVEVLAHKGYFELASALGTHILQFRITPFGMNEYAESYIEDYKSITDAVAAKVLNEWRTRQWPDSGTVR